MAKARSERARVAALLRGYEHKILVLQGGGALGAYQAGVYDALAAAGIAPDWITGVSIGAVNAALIAGNPPEQRVAQLERFWQLVSSGVPFVPPASFNPLRPALNRLSAVASATFGVPGLFAPRVPPPLLAPDGSVDALSIYEGSPLARTLEELVDFDMINRKEVRLSIGAVNVLTGNSVYFDNHERSIGPEHVLASAALPPGLPPVMIDGEAYWDGGMVSNSPLWYVLDDSPRMSALILQVDLFSARGEMPQNLDQVLERAKDIQYSSKTRFNTARVKELEELRLALHRVLRRLPQKMQRDPDVQRLTQVCNVGNVTIAHLINRRNAHSASFKDYEFSRATMLELWASGRDDVRQTIAHPELLKATEVERGVRIYDLAR
ncbi:MAG: patatin-like phospholipase family protein [Betaproteobacteria bacterium]